FFFQAEDGIRYRNVTGVQTCALPILGVEAESGGTAMTQVMNKMSNAVADGGEDLQAFASAAGVSSEEFAKAFNDRPIEALTMLRSEERRVGSEGSVGRERARVSEGEG